MNIPVLGSSRRDPHGAVAAVDTLHLNQGSLLVALVAESDESIPTRLAGLLVGHDLRRLAGVEARLEESDEDELVDFVAQITDENGEFGAAVIAAVNKSTTRGPVKTENAVGVGNALAVELEGLLGSLRAAELDKAVSGVTGKMSARVVCRRSWHETRQGRCLSANINGATEQE